MTTEVNGQYGPSKRWGHTSVEALNRMFIIGGYQGTLDFHFFIYFQISIEYNHSSLIYF